MRAAVRRLVCLPFIVWTVASFTTVTFYAGRKPWGAVGSAIVHKSTAAETIYPSVDPGNSSTDLAYATSQRFVPTYARCGKCDTVFAVSEQDLGSKGKGRRLECGVCSHSWFQSRDRLMVLKDGYEMVPLPDHDRERIATNIQEGKAPKFMGEAKLYVGNIAFGSHEDELMQIFSKVGEVGDVSLVRDDEGKIRGFGFITMRTAEDAAKALAQLDGTAVRGRNISVREANN